MLDSHPSFVRRKRLALYFELASPTSTAEMYELPIQGDLRNAA
jgi:hypothetical protein